MRSVVFSNRTRKEILRDPLSYIFCLGFPIIMLIIMTIVNDSIPAEANMKIFQIQSLAPSIAVFGLTFVMLFNCIQVSKDRSTALLIRLYASPMKPVDYIVGYTLPLILLSVVQIIITFTASVVIGLVTGYHFNIGNLFVCLLVLLPTALLFIAFGMLFGSLLSDKAAPAICSIIISAASILGGIWMDIESVGGMLKKVCMVLPFYHGVKAARMAAQGQYSDLGAPLLTVTIYAIAIYALAVLVFRSKMQKDIK